MAQWLSILIGMILVNNYVLAQFLGICPFLGVSKKLDSAVGMGVAVTFVMVLATAATWPIMLVLNKFEIAYYRPSYSFSLSLHWYSSWKWYSKNSFRHCISLWVYTFR